MIFKIQFPLASSPVFDIPMALMYNEDRSIDLELPITRDLSDLAQNRFKFFIDGEWDEDYGTLHILSHKVEDPGW